MRATVVAPGSRLRATALATAIAVASLPLPAAAAPPPPTHEERVEALNAEAVERFQAGDYDGAVARFEEAYRLSPEPNYLFNIGRIYEEKGDLVRAVEHYERFMNQPGVELQAREVAVERVRVLRAVIEETARETKTAEPEPVADPEPRPERQDRGRTRPLRITGYAVLGLGAAVLVAGAGFGGAAIARREDLDDLRTLESRDDAIDRGRRSALVADSLFIAGGVLAITGLALTLASLRRKPAQRTAWLPALSPHALGAALDVRF